MNKEWFRRSAWSTEDAKEFEKKLTRAHAEKRAQYLRIQACHLAESSLHIPALQLLDRMLSEYSDDPFIAQAYHQKADSLLKIDKPEEAIFAYRQAMEAQRRTPNIRTNAYLEFSWIIATSYRKSLFDEALEVLKEFGGDEAFPILQFKYFGALAMIYADRGNLPIASGLAKTALAAMDAKESKFRYHRILGLVHDVEPSIVERLKIIAAG